jgi:hypothetical protein
MDLKPTNREAGVSESQDQDRMKIITHYLGLLQGLKAIPFGFILFVLAAQDMGWLGRVGDCSVTIPLFLVVFVILFALDSYYVKLFGRIKPANRRAQMRETTVFLVIFALVIVLESWISPPYSMLGLAVGALFLQTGVHSRRYYYIPLGAVVVVASFMPWVLRMPLTDTIYGTFGVLLKVVIGAVIIAAGLIDHFMLMRALRRL